MSRTRRIYNKIVKKAHRYTTELFDCAVHTYGFVFHPYRALNMIFKDPTLDQKHQRKVRKQEFMREMKMEVVE